MKKIYLIFVIAFGCALLADLVDLNGPPRLYQQDVGPISRSPATLPVSLSPQKTKSLDLIMPATGNYERVVVTVMLKGRARISLEGKKHDLGQGLEFCQSADDKTVTCRVTWQRDHRDEVPIRLEVMDSPATIAEFKVVKIASKRASRLSLVNMNIIIVLILGAIPLIWLLHRKYRESQWLIIAVAVVALALIQPVFGAVLIAFLAGMYRAGMALQSKENKSLGILLSLLFGSIAFLILFKFGLPVLADVFANVGGFSLALPLGVSYFIVRLVDTQINWYRSQLKDLTFREYLCYMIFPPTMAAGPIETAKNFRDHRLQTITKDDVGFGVTRILFGLIKKVVIADGFLSNVVTENFLIVGLDPTGAPGLSVLILLFCNVLFAYLDFSAYSDIAIGLGRLYGYRISENFNFPVLQGNLREYWQNWHMTLSDFAKRNIFMPVALITRNAYIPVFATMIAIALWHNPGVPWFFWALHHSAGLCLLAFLDRKRHTPLPREWLVYGRPLRTLITIFYVSLSHSFILFNSDFHTAFQVYLRGWGLLVGNW